MPGDAVAKPAESRQPDEKPFFENRGQRDVKVSAFGKSEQFFDDLGSFRGEAEKIGNDTESAADAVRKFWIGWGRGRKVELHGHGSSFMTCGRIECWPEAKYSKQFKIPA